MSNVLVVEDNLANQRLVRMLLESMGHTPVCALTGEEGWALAQEENFPLVLLDIHLPGMDGMQLASKLRGLFGKRIKIVAVTALAMEGDRQRILSSGCDGYIAKPISIPEFRQTVESIIGASHA